MKLLNLDGNLVNVDVRPSSYPLRGKSKSELQQKTKERILELYPRDVLLEEFVLPNSRMSIDLISFARRVAYEIDGEGHQKYTPFFHGQQNLNNFGKQISRDRKKDEWCQLNNIELIRIESEKDLDHL